MKKKIVLSLVFALLLLCVMAFTVGAAEMTNYCDAKLTLVSGESVTGYFEVSSGTIVGSAIYKTTDKAGEQYSWEAVVVVDMRGFNYVGKTPTAIKNFGSKINSTTYAGVNTEQVYLPDTILSIPRKFLTKEWLSIKTLYISKSVETITGGAFNLSLVEEVIFEEGSNLIEIGNGAFRECPNLTTIEFPDKLQVIGTYAFTLSGLSGTIKLPNSLTSIGDSAFVGTKIETLYFGNGSLTLGKNIVGDDTGPNNYLRKVYISTGTNFSSEANLTWCTPNDIISFYVVSEGNEDASEFIQKLRLTGRLVFTTLEEIEAGIAPEGYNAIIYESVSVCDAFNNGAHNQPGEAELIFTNAFTDFYEAKECVACNRLLPAGDSYAPIVSLVGYSTRENGTGFCVEYKINQTSYAKYKEYHDGMSFGLILSIVGEETENLDIVNVGENGAVTAKDTNKTAVLNISDTFSGFTLKLSGFGENHSELNIVLSVFAYDGEKVLYLNDKTASETLDTIAVGQIIK